MGEATAELTEPKLREIGRSISIYDREKAQKAVRAAYEEYIDPNRERAEKGLSNAPERGYNALTPSGEEQGNEYIESAQKSVERSDYGDRVHSERRLSDPEPDSEQGAGGMLTKFGLMRRNFLKEHRLFASKEEAEASIPKTKPKYRSPYE